MDGMVRSEWLFGTPSLLLLLLIPGSFVAIFLSVGLKMFNKECIFFQVNKH